MSGDFLRFDLFDPLSKFLRSFTVRTPKLRSTVHLYACTAQRPGRYSQKQFKSDAPSQDFSRSCDQLTLKFVESGSHFPDKRIQGFRSTIAALEYCP
jgi:hypothetical protein